MSLEGGPSPAGGLEDARVQPRVCLGGGTSGVDDLGADSNAAVAEPPDG